ncbi:MAG: hypothetical protein ACREHE_14110 [Rhizomicrobium sp.]
MPRKLPVGAIVAQSFGFAVTRYPALLGAVWLPALVFVPAASVAALLTPALYGPTLPLLSAVLLATVVEGFAIVWMGAAATRIALGIAPRWRFVDLPGMDELRVLGVYTIAFIFLSVLFACIGGAVFAIDYSALLAMGEPAPSIFAPRTGIAGAIVTFGALAYQIAFFYLAFRLSLLIQPATIATGRLDVFAGWNLLRGNSVHAIGLLIVPVVILFAVLSASVAHLLPAFPPSAGWIAAGSGAHAMPPGWLAQAGMMTALWLAVAPFAAGLFCAPAALAYRVLSTPASLPAR